MYNHTIGVNDGLWDIIEDDVRFTVGLEGMVVINQTIFYLIKLDCATV